MNKTNHADLNDLSANFNSFYFSVRNVQMLANSFKGKKKFPQGGKLGGFTVLLEGGEAVSYTFELTLLRL